MHQLGGTDLLAQIIKVYKPNLRISNVIAILDIVVVTLNIVFFKELEIGLYSAITIYISGKMLDIFFEGIDFTKVLYIISPHYEKIAKQIGNNVKRGSTLFYGKGMYKGEERNTLMCVASRGEIMEIMRIVKSIDKNSFIVITNAREAFGKGFKT